MWKIEFKSERSLLEIKQGGKKIAVKNIQKRSWENRSSCNRTEWSSLISQRSHSKGRYSHLNLVFQIMDR